MKHILTVFVFLAGITYQSAAQQEGFAGRPITENLFMYTGNTLHQGELTIGIGPIAYGITENFQLETNLLLYIVQYYNFAAKVSFIDTEQQALAAGLGFGSLNLDVGDSDFSFTLISPFVAYTTAVGPDTRLHLNGNYTYFSGDADIEDASASSSAGGTSIGAGIEHSISNKTKILADLGYDLTFSGVRAGAGVLFGWESFRLKLGGQIFSVEGESFLLPYIGLWWRFEA